MKVLALTIAALTVAFLLMSYVGADQVASESSVQADQQSEAAAAGRTEDQSEKDADPG